MSPLLLALPVAAALGVAAWRIALDRRRAAARRVAREKATQDALKAARTGVAATSAPAPVPTSVMPSRVEIEAARATARAKAQSVIAAEAARRQAQTQKLRAAQDEADRRAEAAVAALRATMPPPLPDVEFAPTVPMSLDPLPSAPPPVRPVSPPARKVAPPRAAKTPAQTLILLVDDSKMVRIMCGRLLEANGYQVITAVDGLDALARLETCTPDLVITDVDMPGMDGFGLVNALRINAATRHLPLVMITSAEDDHREAARRAGVGLVLGKPYDEAVLLAHLRGFTFLAEPALAC